MTTPPFLKPGDCVGMVSPAKKIDAAKTENAIQIIEHLGYKVKNGQSLLAGKHYFAGSDAERKTDFQQMLDNPEIKMIVCSRGGYGSVRIIDELDFSVFKKNPKWIAGYSDITVFHSHLFNMGFESLHSTMPLDFPEGGKISEPVRKMLDLASGEGAIYQIEKHIFNKPGIAEGMLVGGNLSIICSLLGSFSDVDTQGTILFIEEVGEDLYHFDRMMQTLKRAGKLKGLAGLLVGGLTNLHLGNPQFDLSAEEIILDAVSKFTFPVAFGFPAGHFPENYPLVIGRKVKLEVFNKVKVTF